MTKKLLAFFFVSLASLTANAEQTKTTFNPFTGKFDFITKIDTNTITPGTGITITCTNGACTVNAGGSSASNLEVFSGPTQSSPIPSISIDSNTFTSFIHGATYYFTLKPDTTGFIWNSTALQTATFNVSSGTSVGFIATDSTSTNLSASTIRLLNQGNTRIVFMNGNNLASASNFTWNGTTITAPMVSASTFTANQLLKVTGTDGATITFGLTASTITATTSTVNASNVSNQLVLSYPTTGFVLYNTGAGVVNGNGKMTWDSANNAMVLGGGDADGLTSQRLYINATGMLSPIELQSTSSNNRGIKIIGFTDAQAFDAVSANSSGGGDFAFCVDGQGTACPNYTTIGDAVLYQKSNPIPPTAHGPRLWFSAYPYVDGSGVQSNGPNIVMSASGTIVNPAQYPFDGATSIWVSTPIAPLQVGWGSFPPTISGSSQSIVTDYPGDSYHIAIDSTSRVQTFIGVKGGKSVIGTSTNTWNLPSADASGCFQSDGSGNMSIASCGGGGSGDMILASTQTVSGEKIFTSTRSIVVQPKGDLGVTIGLNAYGTDAGSMYDMSTSTSLGLVIFNNAAQTVGSANSMLTLISTNPAYGGYFMRIIRTDSNSNGELRIDSPNPNIESVETDAGCTGPVCKFELGINSGVSYWATRNANDDSFERTVEFPNKGSTGGGIVIKTTGTLKLEDSVSSSIGFKAPDTLGATWTHDLWKTSSNQGLLLKQTSNSGLRALAWSNTVGVAASSITFSSSVVVANTLSAADVVATTNLSVNGQNVCQANGTNCPAGSNPSIAFPTGNYTAASTATVVLADATGGSFTVTLPTAVGASGLTYRVKRLNSGANTVTVGTTSSQTIDGSTTQVLNVQYTSIDIISDGSNWSIL